MGTLTLDRKVEIYSKELSKTLIKKSKGKLKQNIANKVARQYAENLDYEDVNMMHSGVSSIASILLTRIKPSFFED